MKVKRLPEVACFVVGACALLSAVNVPDSGAAAVAPTPMWKIDQSAQPTYLEPGSVAPAPPGIQAQAVSPKLRVALTNVGGASFGDAKVVDTLPVGLSVAPGIEPEWRVRDPQSGLNEGTVGLQEVSGSCSVALQVVSCTVPNAVLAGVSLKVFVPLQVTSLQPEVVQNEVTVESTGAPTVIRRIATPISTSSTGFSFVRGDQEGLAGGAYDQAGGPARSGAHPFAVEMITKVSTKIVGAGTPYYEPFPTEALRTLSLSLPHGVVVNPLASAVRCTKAELEEGEQTCPAASQVGVVTYDLLRAAEASETPLYNIVPEPGVPAEFGFNISGPSVVIRGGLDGDFNLTASSSEILSRFSADGVRVQLWGVPSDSRHNRERVSELPTERCRYGCGIIQSPRPFVTMPSSCKPSLDFMASATSWIGSADNVEEQFKTANGQVESLEGCEELKFSPSVEVAMGSSSADSPTGLSFRLKVPQNEALGGLATANVKKVSVRLPAGFAVNPPASNGLAACSEQQISLGTTDPEACPDASKVGTAEIATPLLTAPLKGSVYVAAQKSNPFGTLLALYLAVEGEGVVIKLPGRVDVNHQSGQVTTTFDDNPELPFEELTVNLNGGPRAVLVTPRGCGAYSAETQVTSWASETPIVLASPMNVDSGCSGGFSPKLNAGTSSPAAGQYSPFTLRVTREDDEQNVSRVSATLPEGLLAKLAGVPLCPDAQAASGNCPVGSQVGTTTTGVGAGVQPLYIPQSGKTPTAVYLAGPYSGAPYSLVVKVPAEAGPFNLGTIAVRVALNVDPFTAQVTAQSDVLPQILEGIPVAYRDIRVEISKPDFVRNPTSCEPMLIQSLLISSAGAIASPSSRFQVAGCAGLSFKPALKLSLTGSTKRTGHPGLKAVLTYPKTGEWANIRRAQVNLPHSEFLDQGNLNRTCTRPILLEGKCPRASVYGRAKAWTPLLDRPLEGPIYLVGGFGYKLPALVAELGGQLRVLLKGKVDTGPNGGIRNTFEAVPDAPVSRFVLELKGGKKYGLLQNSENLCHLVQRGLARFVGHNGAVEQFKPVIANQCRKRSAHHP